MDDGYRIRLEKIEALLAGIVPEFNGNAPGSAKPWLENFVTTGAAVPADLANALIAPAGDMLARGGKRWRPLLMTLLCEALGGGENALPLTPLVELPHNASLIHDDIEDNSDERRGKPAVHLIYGTDTAINSGSFLYFLPLSCIDRWDAPAGRKYTVYRLWAEHLRRLHLGQAMDIAWHRDFSAIPARADYELMCRLKTGALARLAALLGAYAAGLKMSPAGRAAELGNAAELLGVGFQILDDVKNLETGNPGKKRGDDIVEGKKSLPVLLFLEKYPEKAPFVERCFKAARSEGAGAVEVEELIAVFEKAGVLEESKNSGEAMLAQSRQTLAVGEGEARRLLEGLVSGLG
jgi:octaprenyl-diphosphate synthase